MPDLSEYPVQGRLRIRQGDFERDREFIRAGVAYLSEPVLKSVEGYAILKFWYADFAATHAQWAALAPELDKRNILVTLYEAPVLYAEALADEQEKAGEQKPHSRLSWLYNGAAAALLVLAIVLLAMALIDVPACVVMGGGAIGIAVAGQVHVRFQTKRNRKALR